MGPLRPIQRRRARAVLEDHAFRPVELRQILDRGIRIPGNPAAVAAHWALLANAAPLPLFKHQGMDILTGHEILRRQLAHAPQQ